MNLWKAGSLIQFFSAHPVVLAQCLSTAKPIGCPDTMPNVCFELTCVELRGEVLGGLSISYHLSRAVCCPLHEMSHMCELGIMIPGHGEGELRFTATKEPLPRLSSALVSLSWYFSLGHRPGPGKRKTSSQERTEEPGKLTSSTSSSLIARKAWGRARPSPHLPSPARSPSVIRTGWL